MRSANGVLALVLLALCAAANGAQKEATPPPAPRDARVAAERYFELNMEGASLTTEGRAEVAKLRLGSLPAASGEIDVLLDLSPGYDATTGPGTAVTVVWSRLAGFLDSKSGSFRAPAPGLMSKGDYDLKLVGGQWKVVDPGPRLLIGVAAAERYVQDLLDHSKDPAFQRNAKRTLATLQNMHWGQGFVRDSPANQARRSVGIQRTSLRCDTSLKQERVTVVRFVRSGQSRWPLRAGRRAPRTASQSSQPPEASRPCLGPW